MLSALEIYVEGFLGVFCYALYMCIAVKFRVFYMKKKKQNNCTDGT